MLTTPFAREVFVKIIEATQNDTSTKHGWSVKPVNCQEHALVLQVIKKDFIGAVVIIRHPHKEGILVISNSIECESKEQTMNNFEDTKQEIAANDLVKYFDNLKSNQKIIKRPSLAKFEYN